MRFLARIFKSLTVKRQPDPVQNRDPRPISKRLEDNIDFINKTFTDSSDLRIKRIKFGKHEVPVALIYLVGLTNEQTIQENILGPLLRYDGPTLQADATQQLVLEVGDTQTVSDLHKAIDEILHGEVVLFRDGTAKAISIAARIYQGRAISEPNAEMTITGPRDGFVENVQQNLALVRKRLPTSDFKSVPMRLGTVTQTAVVVCYVQGFVEPQVLQEVMNRLRKLEKEDLTSVLDTSYIAQAIEDHPWSLFPQTAATERPDRMVASLLDGKVCILVDGTPKALILPMSLPDMFQSPEDFYVRPLAATVTRWMRYIAAILATSASAVYVAVMTFHYEVIPQRLIVSVASNRALVPFPSLFEALVMEATAEFVREATNRLPSTVGQVIGVVGALVLGQSAVQANLVSPLLVIVVAMSTISSFAIPNNPNATALRMMRFPLILASGFL